MDIDTNLLDKGYEAVKQERDELINAKHKLSDAYLRLREILGAWDTPKAPTSEQVWKHTEDKAYALVAHVNELREGFIENTAALYVCRDNNNLIQARIRAEALYSMGSSTKQTKQYFESLKRKERNKVRRECAMVAYRTCAETRHVTIGDKCSEAIEATIEPEE